MARQTVEDIIAKGIHGAPQLNIDEKILFLGCIRERVELALFREQVLEKQIYPEVVELLKSKKDISLILNGKMPYTCLSKYLKLCDKNHVHFSMINDLHNDTEIGLVITNKTAIDNEFIFVD